MAEKIHKITVEKPTEFMPGFLVMCPVPMIPDPEWPEDSKDPAPLIPEFTDDEWFVEWLIGEAFRAYGHGIDKLAKQASVKKPKTTLFKCKQET